MKELSLTSMFHDTLRDIYYAERKILKTLPKMARAAQSEELRAAFQKHAQETEVQLERLQEVFALIGKRAQAKTCPAIDGIMDEGDEVMDTYKGTSLIDAGLISTAQAVEHYEMARYRTLCVLAEAMGNADAVSLLKETLQEEQATDAKLEAMAKQVMAGMTAEAA